MILFKDNLVANRFEKSNAEIVSEFLDSPRNDKKMLNHYPLRVQIVAFISYDMSCSFDQDQQKEIDSIEDLVFASDKLNV